MLRLFIAIPLPTEVERQLDRLLTQLRPRSNNVKWVAAKNIHLTVKFLGDTDEALVPGIKSDIDKAAAPYQPFQTTLDTIGAFPNLRRPRVIWVGGSDPIPDAVRLADDIDLRMTKLGFEREKRPFKPHLTLGRVRQGRRVDELGDYLQTFELKPIPLLLDRIVLFKSTLTPQGAIYERLHETRLGEERFGG
jgi:2'-5' RNA ligase